MKLPKETMVFIFSNNIILTLFKGTTHVQLFELKIRLKSIFSYQFPFYSIESNYRMSNWHY